MINIISKTKYAYFFSGALTLLSVLSLLTWGLTYDIDFTGGTLMKVKFADSVPANNDVTDTLKDFNLSSLKIGRASCRERV